MTTSPLLDYLCVAARARAILPPADVHGVDDVQQHLGVCCPARRGPIRPASGLRTPRPARNSRSAS